MEVRKVKFLEKYQGITSYKVYDVIRYIPYNEFSYINIMDDDGVERDFFLSSTIVNVTLEYRSEVIDDILS